MRVHAWVTSSCFEDPEKTVGELLAAGCSVASLMCNDFLKARGPTAFITFSVDKINRMAAACWAAGIEVHLTSWIMPHDLFMDGMLEQMPELMASTKATLLMLDAEGPWADATGVFNYADAAAKAARIFTRLGLSGIGSAPSELCELAKVCRVRSPQGYADDDDTEGSTTDNVVPYSLREWRKRYGEAPDGWIIGLAGYDQGTPAASTMQPPIDDVLADGDHEVAYWSINSIADRDDVTAFLRGLTSAPPVEPEQPEPVPIGDGIFPRLVISSMTKGTVARQLKCVQALLLHAWGFDPGPVDGLPGPKTIGAVEAFQSCHGLPVTGIVDGGTWVELLRA
jgi:hypothetical protein